MQSGLNVLPTSISGVDPKAAVRLTVAKPINLNVPSFAALLPSLILE
jgi:hypothetical protein